nr:phospholipase-like protein [Tanacetum cinerariifolium]
MLDEDVVRLCLLIARELVFMGKEKKNLLTKHIMWLVYDFDAWNAFPWGEYMWEKFYNRTVNVVSRHTEHHLAQLKKNPNFNATYNLYGFAWAFKMSQVWFKDSAEFIKGLDAQGTFLQDDQGREKCTEQHNGICGDTEDDDRDGILDSQTKDVIEEASMLPTMSSNSPQARNKRKDDNFDELTKRFSKLETSETFVKFKKLLTNNFCTKNESSDCNPKKSDGSVSIEEKPNFSSHHNDSSNHIGGVSSEAKASSFSAHPGNDEDVSHLDDNMEIDGPNAKDCYINSQHHLHLLIKASGTKIENPSIDSVVVVPPKVDDHMLHTIKPKYDFDEADVDSYDDDYMSLFNDEEQPAKSSLNDLELQQEPDIVDVKDGILKQQANADKEKTTVIQETVGVTVEEQPSLGRGLGTLKFKKKNCERALRPNYVLRSAKIRKKKTAMSLKSPFGQQSDTTPIPTKIKARLNKTEDIVLPFDLEDIFGQPRTRSMNHIMTHDSFVENLSRPDGCKSDKVTVPEYMSVFINNKDLPEYRFP